AQDGEPHGYNPNRQRYLVIHRLTSIITLRVFRSYARALHSEPHTTRTMDTPHPPYGELCIAPDGGVGRYFSAEFSLRATRRQQIFGHACEQAHSRQRIETG